MLKAAALTCRRPAHAPLDLPDSLPSALVGRAARPRRRGDRVAQLMSASDAVDGSSTGTEVACMWVLLRPPRFGGAKHASGHDNRSRHRKVGFSNPRG